MADKAQNEVEKAPANDAGAETAQKQEQTPANGAAAAPPTASEKEAPEKPSEPVKEEAKDKTDTPEPAPASTDAPKEKDAEQKKKDEDEGGEKPKDDATPAVDEKKAEEPTKEDLPPYLAKNEGLRDLFKKLPSIIEKSGHQEMWGVNLKDADHVPTVIVLMKFLRANEGDAKAAAEQLRKSLIWRKEMNPLALTESAAFPASKFKDLGYVTTYNDKNGQSVVFTWNIYGAVKNISTTFSDVDEFIKWRVVLMELAIRELKIDEATTVFDYDGEDPYQMIQVHDYLNVRFLFMDNAIRKASRTTIEVFSLAYPELLQTKFFVNVPSVMGWVFSALKVFLSKNTVRKFHPLANGASLAGELDGFGKEIPEAYGGSGSALATQGSTVPLKDESKAPSEKASEKKDTKKDENAPKEEKDTKKDEEAPKEEKDTKKDEGTAEEKNDTKKDEDTPGEKKETKKDKNTSEEKGKSNPAEETKPAEKANETESNPAAATEESKGKEPAK